MGLVQDLENLLAGMSFKMSSGLPGSSCDIPCKDTKDVLYIQISQFWTFSYDTWHFYFNATTCLHSILDPVTDNCKSLSKSYFNWLHKRCHVNQKNKNWKDASLIQNSKFFRYWRWVKRCEEIKWKWKENDKQDFLQCMKLCIKIWFKTWTKWTQEKIQHL
jgi:hypothetical protein